MNSYLLSYVFCGIVLTLFVGCQADNNLQQTDAVPTPPPAKQETQTKILYETPSIKIEIPEEIKPIIPTPEEKTEQPKKRSGYRDGDVGIA